MRTAGRGGPRLLAAVLVFALGASASACSGDDDEESRFEELSQDTELAEWTIRPGVELATVTDVEPGTALTLYDDEGNKVAVVEADDSGRAHLAYVPNDPDAVEDIDAALAQGLADGHTLRPGSYVLRDEDADPVLASEPFEVLARDAVPAARFYEDQELQGVDLGILGEPTEGTDLTDGFQYIEMRDGVKLSAMVRFPDSSIYGEGPWPTVIEYSGYGPSNPDSEEPGGRIARSLGYATVSVNMRGTGCSGGIFETFNPAQQADGYDVVEVVAGQDWVLNNQVGMVGLSYSGITQLFTAATQPPSLAAVTAQSVIADPWLQQWPSGIYNDGFTRQWLQERERQSAAGGSEWVQARIDGGDATCAAGVSEHDLSMDFEAFGKALEMRPPDADARDLRELSRDVDTAVFLTGAFQDEQTGPQFGVMLDHFEHARALKVGLWNGRHPDGYSTMNLMQLYEFLEFYVAERVPHMNPGLKGAVAGIVAENFGFVDGALPTDRFFDEFGDDYDAALEAYEDEDPIRVVFGSGTGSNEVGEPGGTFETTFSSWPPPAAEVRTWKFGPNGSLVDRVGATDPSEIDTFTFDADAGGMTSQDEYSTLEALPDWQWTPFPDGKALSYETPALTEDVVVAGSGHVDLSIGVDAPDADVQVSISEVRPDGVEYLVQTGWLRLGHRAVDEERSNEFEIVHPFTADAYERLPEGELVEAKVEIPSMGHVFRAGSRLRVTVSSPGRNHVTWTFQPPEGVDGSTTYRVGRDVDTPSGLVLPVVDLDVPAPPTPAPCPGLRGMACRPYQPIANHTE